VCVCVCVFVIVCVCVAESRWRLTLGQEENGCGGCAYIIQLKVLSGVSLSLSLSIYIIYI